MGRGEPLETPIAGYGGLTERFDLDKPVIAAVNGVAMGGGFEFALSSDVIVAEQGARMGLPEVMFNLFPGMGAYNLLARRVGARVAEEMMMSGNIYQAEDLHRMGVVDVLAPRGEGEKAVDEFIRKRGRRFNAIRSIYQCRQFVNPVSHEQLMNIANLWVDAVLRRLVDGHDGLAATCSRLPQADNQRTLCDNLVISLGGGRKG